MGTQSERIREARTANRLSQQRLADLLGVTKAAISQWENSATKQIKYENLIALEKITGFSAQWLSTGRGPRLVTDGRGTAVNEPPSEYAYRKLLDAVSQADLARYSTDSIVQSIITLANELKRRG